MIKNLLIPVLFFVLFISCNSNSATNSAQEEESQDAEKKITKRDLSITPANAYNNLFFDSAVLVKFFTDNKVENKIIRRMTSFYNARNYQLAWFTNNGLTEQARGFWNMHNYQITYANDSALKDKSLQTKMDGFTAEEDGFTVSPLDKNIITTELKLTQHFILYTLNNIEDGFVKRKEMERFIPRKKEDALLLTDSLLSKKHKDNKYYEDINNSYKLLKEKLETYYAIAKQGGWPQITTAAKQLKKGISSPDVTILKKRLQITGDMAADTTPVFDDVIAAGIKNFQQRFGYTPTGVLTDGQIKDLNVPVVNRIQQLLINMGRMQWMINEPKGKMIVVNIPEFILHVKDGPQKVFDMNVVVGKEGHNTMMFTGNLNQVVFSPYWNLPESIVKKEILPAMERNPNYLASHHMEITGNEGGLPVIRQLPGDDNSLGKVKFLFPNSFNIYFHDTPAKSLFDKDKRAYSHGCIRLSDPVKMANYLLKDDAQWPSEKIDSAMNSGKEKYVKVKAPVPVLITYYTAWVDENGLLHFADDIYGHDKAVIEKMFTRI
ncbi:L,D-transpeptidase family protein [Ferruginibacter sp.]